MMAPTLAHTPTMAPTLAHTPTMAPTIAHTPTAPTPMMAHTTPPTPPPMDHTPTVDKATEAQSVPTVCNILTKTGIMMEKHTALRFPHIIPILKILNRLIQVFHHRMEIGVLVNTTLPTMLTDLTGSAKVVATMPHIHIHIEI
jgi:hypothetical protein